MLQGKPAVAAFLQGLFGGNTLRDVKGKVTDILIGGDLAVETGTYTMTIIPRNGSAVADKGKYIHVWKKSVDGSWRVVGYLPNFRYSASVADAMMSLAVRLKRRRSRGRRREALSGALDESRLSTLPIAQSRWGAAL